VTTAEIRDAVLRSLAKVAPEVRGQEVAPSVSLRDQLDLDSMDALNFVIALHGELGVAIPEADYAKLTTLDGIVRYLAARLSEAARQGPET
jgi:acyl carrier protein